MAAQNSSPIFGAAIMASARAAPSAWARCRATSPWRSKRSSNSIRSGSMQEWFHISNADEIPSPSLLLYTERIDQNIEKMIRTAGGVERLRPHMKTHKLPELIQKQLARGINKFKCATIAEAEMVASCGAPDVLLAYQPVGPNVQRLCALIRQFPKTRFSTVIDNESSAKALSETARQEKISIDLFLDIDCGQHRTGIEPGEGAFELYKSISVLSG